jgi:hypothetical protein
MASPKAIGTPREIIGLAPVDANYEFVLRVTPFYL